ncbi:hypothetical protein [Paraburkholderia sp. BCC1876]|uniref:hypothetical protein n=1 Tax=Paraburkholderia sp. BCC1876 TaxID=2676303 RepID=UPI001591987C|nr:hypothetical protein [Paraburkholderia sp. BCC1876]
MAIRSDLIRSLMEWASFHRLRDKIMRNGVGLARTDVGSGLCLSGKSLKLLSFWIMLAQNRDGTNPKIKFCLARDIFLILIKGELIRTEGLGDDGFGWQFAINLC